jgi:hypothetical protein
MIMSRSTPTFYVRFGDWFAYLCVAGLAALVGRALVHRYAFGAAVPQAARS